MQKTAALVTDMLSACDEPEWAVSNEKFYKVMEYMLWDTFRSGLTLHLAGCSQCIFVDLDRLMALLSKALGKNFAYSMHLYCFS